MRTGFSFEVLGSAALSPALAADAGDAYELKFLLGGARAGAATCALAHVAVQRVERRNVVHHVNRDELVGSGSGSHCRTATSGRSGAAPTVRAGVEPM